MSVTLIVGDAHIGKSLSMGKPGIGSSLNSRVADQFRLLDWVFEQAVELHATSIIFTGDIFQEAKPDTNYVVLFLQWLKKCEAYNINVHVVVGNHDIKRSGSQYTSSLDIIQSASLTNTFVYKDINTFYNQDVGFTLVPFRDRRSFNLESASEAIDKIKQILLYEVNSIPYTYDKVLVGHLAIEGSIMVGDEVDDSMNELMCPLNMFEGYNYVWMGHVHKPQVLNSKPHIAHIGSLDLSDFGETDHQKIVIVYDSDSKDKFTYLNVPSRPLRKLSVTINDKATDSVLAALLDLDDKYSLKDSILKIEVKLSGPDVPNTDRQKVVEAAYSYGIHHLCSFSESRTISVVPIENRQNYEEIVNPKVAVKMFADVSMTDESGKQDFITLCNSIIDEEGK